MIRRVTRPYQPPAVEQEDPDYKTLAEAWDDEPALAPMRVVIHERYPGTNLLSATINGKRQVTSQAWLDYAREALAGVSELEITDESGGSESSGGASEEDEGQPARATSLLPPYDPRHPYFDPTSPDHDAAVRQVAASFERAFPA